MVDLSNRAIEKRVRYFDGQYLKADDFIEEQQYHIDRQRRPLQFLCVSGILSGLKVTQVGDFVIALSPGSAIDAQGQQMILQSTALIRKVEITKKSEDAPNFTLDLKDLAPSRGTVVSYLVISHSEIETDKQEQGGSDQYTRSHERPIVEVTASPTAQDITLAKLTFSTSRVEIGFSDRRYSGLRFPTGDDSELTLRSQGSNQIDLQGNLSITGNTGLGTASSSARLEVKGATDTADAIALSVTNSSAQSLLNVRNDGNIGIGTPQPGSRLSVLGGVAIGKTYASTKQAPEGNLIVEGSLGIGTATPQEKLSIQGGTLSIDQGSTNDPAIVLNSSSAGWGSGILFSNTATNAKTYGIYSGSDGKLHFSDWGSDDNRLVIDPDGNVGIGTSSPGAKLEISGTFGTVLSVGVPAGIPEKNSIANIDLAGHVQLKEFGKDKVAYLQARDDTSNRNIGLRIRTQQERASPETTPEIIDALTVEPSGKLSVYKDLSVVGSLSAGKLIIGSIETTKPFIDAGVIEFGRLEAGNTGRTFDFEAIFSRRFDNPPNVHVAFSQIDSPGSSSNLCIQTFAVDPGSRSCPVKVKVWAGTIVNSGRVTWIAFAQ